MEDPVSAAAFALQVGTDLVGPALRRFARSDEVSNLFRLLDEEFGAETGLSASFWGSLRDDERVLGQVAACLVRGDAVDREALAASVAPHVGALDPDGSVRETTDQVAEAILRLAPRAKATPRDAVHHESERTRHEISQLRRASPRLSWTPRHLRDELIALSEEDFDIARLLSEALADQASRPRALRTLVRRTPDWMRDAPAAAWRLLASLAAAHGLLDVAERALERAATRPHPRPAQLLAGAAVLASRRGATKRFHHLLGRAVQADPEDPAIAIARAEAEGDAESRLAALAEIRPIDAKEEAQIACLRAEAHATLGDLDAALSDAALASSLDPEAMRPRELEAGVILMCTVQAMPTHAPNGELLGRAAVRYQTLAVEMDALDRDADAAWLRARAASCHLLAEDRAAAARALEAVAPAEISGWSSGPACEVASALLEIGRAEDAVSVLDALSTEEDEAALVRAEALLTVGEPTRLAEALDLLDNLVEVGETPAVRFRAAFERQMAALVPAHSTRLSSSAEAVLDEFDPALSAIIASRALYPDDAEAAKKRLLAHQSDGRALHRLSDIAADEGDIPRALELLEAALERTGEPRVKLRYALLLARQGRAKDALAVLEPLWVDRSLPTRWRTDALALAVDIQAQGHGWSEIERLARQWERLSREDPNPTWQLAQALARLGRHPEALAALEARGLDAQNEDQAGFLAVLSLRAVPAMDAVARITALSQRYEGRLEQVELSLLMASVAVGDQELPPDVAQHLKKSLAAFPTTFPSSTAIRAIPAPKDGEALADLLREHLAERDARMRELTTQVRDGKAPLALIAAAGGREVSTVWGRMGEGLPIGFASETLDAVEQQDAAAAISGACVIDSSSLVVAGGLGPTVREAIIGALPASRIPQSVLDDADQAAVDTVLSAGQEGRGFLGWDQAADRPTLLELAPDEVERDDARASGVLELAKRFRATPDVSPDRSTELDQLLGTLGGARERPLATWAATIAVARRHGLPVYSDDRVIRVLARRDGLKAFGTPSLLDALVDRKLISPELRLAARRRLWASGVSGLVPSAAEIIECGRSARWAMNDELRALLLDPAPWLASPSAGLLRWLDALRVIHLEGKPKTLGRWAARIARALQSALGLSSPARPIGLLLALAWTPWDEASGPFFRALVAAGRYAGRVSCFGDPRPGVVAVAHDVWDKEDPGLGRIVTRAGLRQLGAADLIWFRFGLRDKWGWH